MKKELTEEDFKNATIESLFSQKNVLNIVTEPNRGKILKALEDNKKLSNELNLAKLGIESTTSMLLSVQQDCIKLNKENKKLKEEIDDLKSQLEDCLRND